MKVQMTLSILRNPSCISQGDELSYIFILPPLFFLLSLLHTQIYLSRNQPIKGLQEQGAVSDGDGLCRQLVT